METGTGWIHIEKSPGPEPCCTCSPWETYVLLLSVSSISESSNAWPVIQDKSHRFLIKMWVIGNVNARTYDNWVLRPGPEFEYWGEIQPESPILDEIFSSSSSGWSFSVLCHVWILVVFLSLRSFVVNHHLLGNWPIFSFTHIHMWWVDFSNWGSGDP